MRRCSCSSAGGRVIEIGSSTVIKSVWYVSHAQPLIGKNRKEIKPRDIKNRV